MIANILAEREHYVLRSLVTLLNFCSAEAYPPTRTYFAK